MSKKGAKHPAYNVYMEIIWDDASTNEGWVETSVLGVQRVITRGWLVKETKEYISLAASIYSDSADYIGGVQTIPHGMIISRRELKVSNVRKQSQDRLHPKPHAEEVYRESSKG